MRQVLAALVTALVVVASAFGVAGCGGGDDEGSGATTATETTAEETTETTPAAGGGEAGLLEGTVGPDFTIDLQQNYEPLTTLSPGSYQLVVEDYSAAHNFHLTGPGVDVSTDVAAEGTEAFTVQLETGTYTFVCDPHATQMKGSFEVS